MSISSVADAVALLRAGVDAVLDCDFAALDGADIVEVIGEIDAARRRLDFAETWVLAAAEDRRMAGEFAAATLVDVLIDRLHLDAADARRRVRRFEELGPRHSLLGEPLDPILPAAAAALRAGEITAAHADVVIRVCEQVERLPGADPHDGEIAEKLLVEASLHEAPKIVDRLGQELLARLDQDGTEPADERIARKRALTTRTNADGSSVTTIHGDAELTAILDAVLEPLAAPQRCESRRDGAEEVGPELTAEGDVDDRSPAQRRHDALRDALHRLMRSGDLPTAGGVPTTVIAHVRLDQLDVTSSFEPDGFDWEGEPEVVDTVKKQLAAQVRASLATDGGSAGDPGHGDCGGYAVTSRGGLLSGRRLAIDLCEAEVDVVATSPSGAVLALGRSVRLANRPQRIALAARDGGCCFPGCTRPPTWCEAHHVIPWLFGGRTDLNNLCLLCSFHHRRFESLGWSVRMTDGVPEWIPPRWIDPERTPRRNHARHLLDLEFVRALN